MKKVYLIIKDECEEGGYGSWLYIKGCFTNKAEAEAFAESIGDASVKELEINKPLDIFLGGYQE